MPAVIFQKVHNSPLKVTWLCSRTPGASFVVPPLGLATTLEGIHPDIVIACVKVPGFPARKPGFTYLSWLVCPLRLEVLGLVLGLLHSPAREDESFTVCEPRGPLAFIPDFQLVACYSFSGVHDLLWSSNST